nr:hypothetical protein [uncultured Duganella sp.]
MSKTILRLLSMLVVAASASGAMAQTVYGDNIDVTVSHGYAPVSHAGNAFTFSGNSYVLDGGWQPATAKTIFTAQAHAGQALTGKLSFTMELQYEYGATPFPSTDYTAFAQAQVDVLAPHCPQGCGPFDSDLVGTAQGYASSTTADPVNGTLTIISDQSQASGNYNLLLTQMLEYVSLNPAYGSLTINSFTITFETVSVNATTFASPVPELPPAAMFGAGIVALGLTARLRQARRARRHLV